jgi:hypothetical protein
VNGVLLGLDLVCAQPAVFAHMFTHGVARTIPQALSGEMGAGGKVIQLHRVAFP